MVEGANIDRMEGIIQPTLRSHNASYVANLVIQFKFVTTDLISPIKALGIVVLLLRMLVIKTLYLLCLPLLIILQMTLDILILAQVII